LTPARRKNRRANSSGQTAKDARAREPRKAKAPDAYRTIGEAADELGVPQHVLRFWEEKFPQLRPLKRAGGRRYYRPRDILIAERIRYLTREERLTTEGARRRLSQESMKDLEEPPRAAPAPTAEASVAGTLGEIRDDLCDLRDALRRKLGT